jgi:aspartate/methionine/tyrosine aminotransferase
MKVREEIADSKLTIRRISEIARNRPGCIRFDIGQPDFDTPKHIKDAAIEALQRGETAYGPIRGIDQLRDTIATYESKKGLKLDESNIIVTCGGMQAIFIACLGYLNEGDEVIVPDPYWAAYSIIIAAAHGKIKPVHFIHNSKLLPDVLKRNITDKTKMLIINSPSNPTGESLDDKDLKEIAKIAQKNDLVIISDEVYERMLFSSSFKTIAKFAQKNTIRINSLSKTYAMTGWRLGWLTADKDIVAQLEKCSRATIACPPTFIQFGAIAALTQDQSCVDMMMHEYTIRYHVLKKRVDSIGWDYVEPMGTFYMFIDVKKDSWPFCLKMIEDIGVSAVPGEAFGKHGKTYTRFCFGSVNSEKIDEAFDRIERWIR